jgi:hypothetical protein
MFSRQGTITRVKRGSTGSVYGDRNAVWLHSFQTRKHPVLYDSVSTSVAAWCIRTLIYNHESYLCIFALAPSWLRMYILQIQLQ